MTRKTPIVDVRKAEFRPCRLKLETIRKTERAAKPIAEKTILKHTITIKQNKTPDLKVYNNKYYSIPDQRETQNVKLKISTLYKIDITI